MSDLHFLGMLEAMFRANVCHFLPDYPAADYDELYLQVKDMQLKAAEEYVHASDDYLDGLGRLMVPWIDHLRARPGIVATYHLGSYRLLNLCLARQGIPLALVLSADVVKRERVQIVKRYERLGIPMGQEGGLVLLEAEDPRVLFRMRSLLKQGYCLLLYVDGNTGVVTESERHLMEIPFLSGFIRVRQGMALLSFLSDVPLFPVWMDEQGTEARFVTPEAIVPVSDECRWTYAARATRALFGHLERVVAANPAQWECWRYIHHWAAPEGRAGLSDAGLLNHTERWQKFSLRGNEYLLDSMDYSFYPMSNSILGG